MPDCKFAVVFLPAMENLVAQRASRQVATWLLIGVGMIIIQVLLGGITRLTESGLSITEWKPITGVLPPMNEADWMAEFEKYKHTDQFKFVHAGFALSDFKFIFFWEWFHRVWARFMGLVFIAGFVYFLLTKKFNKGMIRPMIILFILGALQGAIGWIMVKSGLVPEKYFVGHIELTTHFIAALGLLCYVLWFALSLLVQPGQLVINPALRKGILFILVVLAVQLVYGGFMAGLKAAVSAPSWPDINGHFIPPTIGELSPWPQNLVNNNLTIHFIHRGLAYLLVLLAAVWFIRARGEKESQLFVWTRTAFLLLVLLQVLLGIFTVLNATYASRLVVLGVAHQFTAMLLLIATVLLFFLLRKRVV